jgi:hypothetical protein
LYTALTDVLPEDGLDRVMGRVELTPIQRHNPRVSNQVVTIIEKCLSIYQEDRYQTANELKYDLLEARRASRRKLPLELVLQPPPISIHDRLPEFERHPGSKSIAMDSPDVVLVKNKSTLPLPQWKSKFNVSNAKQKIHIKNPAWLLLALLPLLVLSGLGIFSIRPDILSQAINNIVLGISTYTPTHTSPTNTQIPFIEIISSTPTKIHTPTSTIIITPLPIYTSTKEPTPTITSTPPPTPVGGAAQIAFASNRSGAVEIWLMNLDGSSKKRSLIFPKVSANRNGHPMEKGLYLFHPVKGT